MKSLNIGRFSKKVTFLKYTTTKDAIGQDKQSLVPFKTVYGDLYQVRANEIYDAKRIEEKNVYKLYVSWFSGLTSDMRVQYNGRNYDITSVVDIDCNNTYYEIYLSYEG